MPFSNLKTQNHQMPKSSCNFQAKVSSYLKGHISSKHGKVRYLCDLCDYATGILHNLKSHKEWKHKSEDYSCRTCRTEEKWSFNEFR